MLMLGGMLCWGTVWKMNENHRGGDIVGKILAHLYVIFFKKEEEELVITLMAGKKHDVTKQSLSIRDFRNW